MSCLKHPHIFTSLSASRPQPRHACQPFPPHKYGYKAQGTRHQYTLPGSSLRINNGSLPVPSFIIIDWLATPYKYRILFSKSLHSPSGECISPSFLQNPFALENLDIPVAKFVSAGSPSHASQKMHIFFYNLLYPSFSLLLFHTRHPHGMNLSALPFFHVFQSQEMRHKSSGLPYR